MHRSNMSLRLQNQDSQKLFNIPVFGSIYAAIRMGGERSMIVDATHSMLEHSIGAIQDMVTTEGTGPYTVLLEYMGVELDFNVAFISDDRIANYRAKHF